MKCVRLAVASLTCLMLLVSAAYGLNGPVALGFLQSYQAPDGSECIHRGVDVALADGVDVSAPVDGVVRFAGRVPGPHGGSIIAVSIETGSDVVSLLPFSSSAVQKGQRVSAGTVLGSLAGRGDPSSGSSHLHVGLKRGSVYLDPSGLIAPAIAPEPPRGAPDPEVSPQPAPAPQAPAVTAPALPAQITEPVPVVPAAAPAPAPAPATSLPVGAPTNAEPVTPAHPAAEAPASLDAAQPDGAAPTIAPGVAIVPDAGTAASTSRGANSPVASMSPPARVSSALSAVGSGLASVVGRFFGVSNARPAASVDPATPARLAVSPTPLLARATSNVASAGHTARPGSAGNLDGRVSREGGPVFDGALDGGRALGYGIALVAAALFGSTILMTRRVLTRSISGNGTVSHRLGTLLQHLKAGDTLCGLTSCPGPLPSQSRGH